MSDMFHQAAKNLLLIAMVFAIQQIAVATAEAGFICADLETLDTKPLADVTVAESSTPTPEGDVPLTPSLYEWFAASHPSDGMSAPTTITSVFSGSAVAILSSFEVEASTLLIAHLGPEGRVWLPPPFSSGVFRPPRS